MGANSLKMVLVAALCVNASSLVFASDVVRRRDFLVPYNMAGISVKCFSDDTLWSLVQAFSEKQKQTLLTVQERADFLKGDYPVDAGMTELGTYSGILSH